jgi:UDP-sulfoquinovose synthase
MNLLILGADGYLGWPTALHFKARGHNVCVMDNYLKRSMERRISVKPLILPELLEKRAAQFDDMPCYIFDLSQAKGFKTLCNILKDHQITTIVHYAEQPSAPFSMRSRGDAVVTQVNNIVGTLNLMFAVKKVNPDIHIIKLGTMGEYGTPNIDIEEGWLDVTHKDRKDRVLFPKRPGSFYHLSKVHDSHNLEFTCRTWGLRVTDLNQGIVYGVGTEDGPYDSDNRTSFHYDETFGTVLNRFIVQSLLKIPLTVYGTGGQQRGFLNIRDTMKCVEIAAEVPAAIGEFKVRNQYTERFCIMHIANCVVKALGGDIEEVPNPRVEAEQHYYNPVNDSFIEDGLCPHFLTAGVIQEMADAISPFLDKVRLFSIDPKTKWVL